VELKIIANVPNVVFAGSPVAQKPASMQQRGHGGTAYVARTS